MSHLPNDVWLVILEYLQPTDILHCVLSSRLMHHLVFENHENHYGQQKLWRHLCYTVFADKSIAQFKRRKEKIDEKQRQEKVVADRATQERKEKRRVERKLREAWRIENNISEDDDEEAFSYYSSDDDTSQEYYSRDGITKGIFDKYEFTITKAGQKTNLCDFEATKLVPKSFDWKTMFSRMMRCRQEWRDEPTVHRIRLPPNDDYRSGPQGPIDRKPIYDPKVMRLIVCGNGRKDLFVNKLVRSLGIEHDEYDVALQGTSQVICLKNCPVRRVSQDDLGSYYSRSEVTDESMETTPKVMLHIVDRPFHYVKHFRGTCLVWGVIYVCDTETFAEEYETLYRELHDVIGEYHKAILCCWFVAQEAENYEFITNDNTSRNASYGGAHVEVINHDDNNTVNQMSLIMRLQHATTCHWYDDARIATSDTVDEHMYKTFAEFLKNMQASAAKEHWFDKRKDGMRTAHYPYSSDDEDKITGINQN